MSAKEPRPGKTNDAPVSRDAAKAPRMRDFSRSANADKSTESANTDQVKTAASSSRAIEPKTLRPTTPTTTPPASEPHEPQPRQSTKPARSDPTNGSTGTGPEKAAALNSVAEDADQRPKAARDGITPKALAKDSRSADITPAKAAPPAVPPAPSLAKATASQREQTIVNARAYELSPATSSPGLADAAAPMFAQPVSPRSFVERRRAGPARVDYHRLAPDGDVNGVLYADHRDPFAFLGMHALGTEGPLIVRVFLPTASSVSVLDAADGESVADLDRIRDEGFFAGGISAREWFPYRLRVTTASGTFEVDDPYRFPPVLSETDVRLLAEGSHPRSYEKLGAHLTSMQDVAGVAFAVWAPHAGRVAVIGDFNDWDGRRHGMRLRHECGVWEIFLPGVKAGGLYKFEIKAPNGTKLIDKSDPFAFQVEKSPGSAAIVCDLDRGGWRDAPWMERRRSFDARRSPVAIYQVHLGSWRRRPEEGHRWLSYQEHANELSGYVKDMGFTHVQLMPVSEFEADASLGYRPSALYAPASRWGTPEQFRLLVDRCHQAGIGVIADWVPNQFSDGPHGLGNFDGAPLYEHPDPRRSRIPGAHALTYDYGRREVANFLASNALFWLDKYHLDGLRVPAVETMLYLDYARAHGEWTPNRFGGHENLEAIDFLRRLNEDVYALCPGAFTIAEENSAWQRVSHPTFVGGLGFGFRCNPAWVRQTLRYLSRNPVHRKYYHDELLRGPAEAFQENYILPLSHGEVSIGKGSLLSKMPGDRWQRFAQLRACYALMYTHPGKKLLFMGTEFTQEREWNSDISLDWHLLGDPMHLGVQRLVRDLNALYRSIPALHELDCEPEGFSWIDCNDSDQSVISFLRLAKDGRGTVAVVCNFTPVTRPHYRIGVPEGGFYRERLNSDAASYGGANIGNEGGVEAAAEPMHGRPFSLALKLPPFATVVLEHEGRRTG